MWIKAKAIKASYDQRVVWTQSNIVLLSWAAVEHLCAFVCAQLHAEPSSQGVHNCWSCVQMLQPHCLFPVTEGALGFTQSGDVFICASIQESGPASIVRYLGEAWVNASRNQLTWLACEREPLFFPCHYTFSHVQLGHLDAMTGFINRGGSVPPADPFRGGNCSLRKTYI